MQQSVSHLSFLQLGMVCVTHGRCNAILHAPVVDTDFLYRRYCVWYLFAIFRDLKNTRVFFVKQMYLCNLASEPGLTRTKYFLELFDTRRAVSYSAVHVRVRETLVFGSLFIANRLRLTICMQRH
jgi:hypothetical protein